MHYKKLHRRLLITLVLILIPAFVGVSVLNFTIQKKAIRRELIDYSLPMVRELINWEIATRLKEPLLASSMMAHDTFLIDWISSGEKDVDKITEYLEKLRQEHRFSTTFLISANSKKYYSYQGVSKELTIYDNHDSWYYTFISSNLRYDFDVDTDEVSEDSLTVFINHRVESDNGDFLGVTGVGMDMSDLAGLLNVIQQRYKKHIYLIDLSGTIQAHSDRELIERQTIYTIPGMEKIADDILASTFKPLDTEYTGSEGNVLLTSQYIDGVDWFIIVEQDEASVLRAAIMNLLRTIFIGLGISLLVVFATSYFIRIYQHHLESIMITDHLTGIYNRIHIDYMLEQEMQTAALQHRPLSILLFDIDSFKTINDAHGHAIGDSILKDLCSRIKNEFQQHECFGRWGGDEFLILMPDTDLVPAEKTAEHIRKKIEQTTFRDSLRITLSFGVTVHKQGDTAESFVCRADAALYQAKEQGKNTVVAT
jgi:diguanylate cyclase (GGDEF)-like protein